MLSVALVHQDVDIRRLFRKELYQQENVLLLGEGANEEEAIALCAEYMPDVLLIETKTLEEMWDSLVFIVNEYPTVYIVALIEAKNSTKTSRFRDFGIKEYIIEDKIELPDIFK